MSKPDPFQELVNSLWRLLQPTTPLAVSPARPQPLQHTTSGSPPRIIYLSPVVRPAPYAGAAEECNGFLLQCSLTIHTQPQLYPSEQCKIAFVISSLTGPALRWAETIWSQAGPATQSFENFIIHFREVFGTTKGDSSIGEQPYHLKQDNMTMHEYTLQFRTLAAASRWNETSLITAFCLGLEPRLRLQLASFDDSQGL